VVGAFDPNSADPGVQKFVQAFRDRFGKEPNGFAAQSYDATSILIEAVARHGPDRNKVQEFVSTAKDFPGVTGKLAFNQGDVEKELIRFVVTNGTFVAVEK
jgi:branched-chain amino acid transport system substrate-binding protein